MATVTDRAVADAAIPNHPPAGGRLLPLLLFASGFSALVYEVLWLRRLAIVFGNDAHAAAVTLAVFFLGLTIGPWAAARYVSDIGNPLRVYALLELAVAGLALAGAVALPGFGPLYQAMTRWTDLAPALIGTKVLVAVVLLVPPAVCLGATLPVLAQMFTRAPIALGAGVGRIYGWNTIGGALGALVAGFALPLFVGLRGSFWLAASVNVTIALVAYAAGGPQPMRRSTEVGPVIARAASGEAAVNVAFATVIAALSGWLMIVLQVVWTRMFALVLHNSVYSFASILVTFLLALGLGGLLASRLSRRSADPLWTLRQLLLVSGIAVPLSAFVFHDLTGGLAYFGGEAGWLGYVAATFLLCAVVMTVTCVAGGAVVPFVLRCLPDDGDEAGRVVGRLLAWNGLGAVAGALCAGFVLLPYLGLWSSLRLVGITYLLLAILASTTRSAHRQRDLLAPALAIALAVSWLDPASLSLVRPSAPQGEVVLSVSQSVHGVLAVIGSGSERLLRLDNYYTLGGTAALANDRRQADLPILLTRDPHSVFFLGMGTGITAGAALRHPVERVVVSELIPEVVDAARAFFADYTNELFSDARVEVMLGDGRHHLAATDERFDSVISELFIPWHSGAGALYTREHFAAVRARLRPGGVFAQWLPLYQMSRREFDIVARTMAEVFPQVTLWRGDFLAGSPIAALVGHTAAAPFDAAQVVENLRRRAGGAGTPERVARALVLLFYAGNVTAGPTLLASAPVNTDDFPVIEYLAPVTQREQRAGRASWLTSQDLIALYDDMRSQVPPAQDPFLALLDDEGRGYVDAGYSLAQAFSARHDGDLPGASASFARFADLVPYDVYAMFRPQVLE